MPFEKDVNEIGVLWIQQGSKGEYMSGTINNEKVVVFRNMNKKSEKSPDWRILKSKPREGAPVKSEADDSF